MSQFGSVLRLGRRERRMDRPEPSAGDLHVSIDATLLRESIMALNVIKAHLDEHNSDPKPSKWKTLL